MTSPRLQHRSARSLSALHAAVNARTGAVDSGAAGGGGGSRVPAAAAVGMSLAGAAVAAVALLLVVTAGSSSWLPSTTSTLFGENAAGAAAEGPEEIRSGGAIVGGLPGSSSSSSISGGGGDSRPSSAAAAAKAAAAAATEEVYDVPLTVLEEAAETEEDALGVCLDGSPPAFHMSRGWGSGERRWIVFLEGGAWCTSAHLCRERARSRLGSSRLMSQSWPFAGMFSNNSRHNPDFFNWNVVYVRYCDGSSFAGQAGTLMQPADHAAADTDAGADATADLAGHMHRHMHRHAPVHYNGLHVLRRVVRHLALRQGMLRATHVLLGGCSAGGLASLLHCDRVQELLLQLQQQHQHQQEEEKDPVVAASAEKGDKDDLPPSISDEASSSSDKASAGDALQGSASSSSSSSLLRSLLEKSEVGQGEGGAGAAEALAAAEPTVVKCLADGGFFIDVTDVFGRSRPMARILSEVMDVHKPVVDERCRAAQGQESPAFECLFPEKFLRFRKQPVYILNALYDNWQVQSVFVPKWERLSTEKDGAGAADHDGDDGNGEFRRWRLCRAYPPDCSEQQLSVLRGYSYDLVGKVAQVLVSDTTAAAATTTEDKGRGTGGDGAFLLSCYVHCQTLWQATWHGPNSPRIGGKTIAEAVGDWFFERQPSGPAGAAGAEAEVAAAAAAEATADAAALLSASPVSSSGSHVLVDCPQFPCNPTCFDWQARHRH